MRYEHLIEINTPQHGLQAAVGQVFTREQLWQGLLARVKTPQRFPNGPEQCVCVEREPGLWHRTQHFGAMAVRDLVQLEPGQGLQCTPEALGDATPIRLSIRIEEPQPGQMVLRFVYEALAELSAEEAAYSGFRQNAWLMNDRDTVRTLREWLAQGRLSVPH